MPEDGWGPDLVTAVRGWARSKGSDPAFVFLAADGGRRPDGPTERETATTLDYATLDIWAAQVAASLQRRYVRGARLLLIFPPGPGFVAAYLGCLYAGMVAVPTPPPGRGNSERQRAGLIAQDCAAAAVLTNRPYAEDLRTSLKESGHDGMDVLAVDDRAALDSADSWVEQAPQSSDVAVLQYTSGSTSDPKGVVLTRAHLAVNAADLIDAYGLRPGDPIGGWLPMYHDMGLLATLTPALFLGSPCVSLSPLAFVKRPHRWLRMIDEFGLAWSAAPNFAYALCTRQITDEQVAGLDLSRWRFAVNGSEPVQAATLRDFAARFAQQGFRPESLTPSYGLAEATVFVSCSAGLRTFAADPTELAAGRVRPAENGSPVKEMVSCGPIRHLEALVVSPGGDRPLPDGEVGELLLRGASVGAGYWGAKSATQDGFGVRTTPDGEPWLRTGDLAVLHEGELFVAGRVKETMIVHGRNLYPQDVEHELGLMHPELGRAGAVFAVPSAQGEEELVVTYELDRAHLAAGGDHDRLARAMRRTLATSFGADPGAVVLLRPGAVLRTTSGKIRRRAMREEYQHGRLKSVHVDLITSA